MARLQAKLDTMTLNYQGKEEELRAAREVVARESLALQLAKKEVEKERILKIKAKSRHNTDEAEWITREKEVRKEYETSNPPVM